MLIAIDPGKTSGFAAYMGGKLIEACAIKEQALLARAAANSSLPGCFSSRPIFVCELPVVYKSRNVPASDLINLAVLVGDLRGLFRAKGFETVLVKPRTWKGTVPKEIHNRRVLRELTQEEKAILPKRPRARDYDHNMIDAVGLGLWFLKSKGQR